MSHQDKYNDLNDLLSKNARAGKFFDTLPSYVQEMIRERGSNIQSEHEMRMYAENIVQGDK
jgi:hypothetical protein